jgi:type VI secretion system secreted protein VgrG
MVPIAALLCNPSPAWAQSLGSASSFAVLGGSAVTAAGSATITGDVGVSPGTSITGFPPATVVSPFNIHNNDGAAIAAQSATGTLYTSLLSGACTALGSDQLNGQNLGPGCHSGGALDLASTGTLTLSGSGTYIFRAASSLVANTLSNVVLTNGASACNVFWQVTSAATLNGISFAGNVVAQSGVTLGSGATLTGRALVRTAGPVTMAGGNTVNGCGGSPAPVPTLSGWAMFLLATLLALVGFAAMRRRVQA